jgi:REP element-mobilizing transposase RayT
VFDDVVDKLVKEVCLEIGRRHEIHFIEIGMDKDHAHFLVQSVPMLNVTRIVTIVKSITAREVLEKMPGLKKELWGSSLWTSGYYVSTVGKHGTETAIRNY